MARRPNFFVEQLKKVMFERELTQTKLAALIGGNQRVISTWLTGTKNPSLSSIKK